MPAPPVHIQTKLRQAFELLNAGRDEEARGLGGAILKTMPREPNALYLMGVLHHKAGDLKDAAKYFEKSHSADRSNSAAYSGIGIVRLDQKRYAEAAKIFEELRRRNPRDPVIANNLGLAYKALEKFDLAVGAFESAIGLRKDYADAYANLGSLLSVLGDNKKALEVLERGNALCPDDPSILLQLGTVQAFEPETDAAVETLRAALRVDPSSIDTRRRLATLLVNRGAFDEARKMLEEIIRADPDDAFTYFDLADLVEARSREDDKSPNEIRKEGLAAHRRARTSLSDTQPLLAQRLAQSLEEVAEYENAFRHYQKAQGDFRKALQAMGRSYDRRDMEDLCDAVIRYFGDRPADVPARFDDGPIFIVGMPRSGTSLLEQVLASHPAIFGAGELMTFPDLVGEFTDGSGDLRDLLPRLDDTLAGRLGRAYLERLPDAAKGHRFVTDKLPVNFLNTGVIRRAFPHALIINALRHPLDIGWSVFVQKFGNHLGYDHDLGDIGHYYAQYDRLMTFWRDWDRSIMPVRYEDMVGDMQPTVMPIIEALGLSWDPAMARFFESDREVKTASRLQVRRPIYSSSVARWKRFEQWLGPMLQEMGDLPRAYEEGKL